MNDADQWEMKMSKLIEELSAEIQTHITNLNNMAMFNTCGKTHEELSIMRAEQNATYAKLRGTEKRLAVAIEFESDKQIDSE